MFIRVVTTAALLASLLGAQPARALRVEPGVGAGLEYTSNAALTEDDEENDWIGIGYAGVSLSDDRGRLQGSVDSSLTYQNYKNDTYSDQYYFNLNGAADWAIRRDRFIWTVANFFTQRPRDTLDPDTPDNTQNTNVFSTGPDLFIPLDPTHRLAFSPRYRNFYYEKEDTDNQQLGMLASWLYQASSALGFSANLDVNKVAYDEDDRNPDYTTTNVFLGTSGRRSRSQFDINAGGTYIQRDEFENESGFLGNLRWTYNLNRHSSLDAYLATELTDTNNGLVRQSVDPDQGDFSDQQISADVLRSKIAQLGYRWAGDQASLSLRGWWNDLDYKQEASNDRRIKALNGNLSYRLAPKWVGSLFGGYRNTRESNTSRRDRTYRFGANLAWDLSGKLKANLSLAHNKRNSTVDSEEYREYRAMASLVYGFGSIQSRGRGR